MTTKNCANGPKLVLKDLCEKSFVRNVLCSDKVISAHEVNCRYPGIPYIYIYIFICMYISFSILFTKSTIDLFCYEFHCLSYYQFRDPA